MSGRMLGFVSLTDAAPTSTTAHRLKIDQLAPNGAGFLRCNINHRADGSPGVTAAVR
jgi:hypothetical protein